MRKTWYFSFDKAPNFMVKVDGKRINMRSKGMPTESELDDWVEATWMRASYHMAEGQSVEFYVLNTVLERFDFEDVCR
jgi:hypothetical protein|tara:strand:- start:2484 stop:2717 length:234 start_codon:yes stop_codon:yes gene_type:complete